MRALGRLRAPVAVPVGLAILLLASAWVWTRAIHAGLWVDEGISIGIAHHPLTAIPGLLRQDGSPPLWYMLLHLWIGVVGDGEARTHALSLIFALLTIPAAMWAGWSIAGRRAGWTCAALAAVNPFLTVYAQETRMYSLVVLLTLLASAFFVHAFVLRHRAFLAPFAVTLAVLLYTHNWALFFTAAAVAAIAVLALRADDRRRLLIDGALAVGGALVLYAPWVPTLIYQAQHTGAPWSKSPHLNGLAGHFGAMLGGNWLAVVLVAGAGLLSARARTARQRRAALALAILAGGTFALAYLASHVSPAWAPRYLAAVLGPLLLLAGLGVARARLLGLALLGFLAWWGFFFPSQVPNKENIREVAALVRPKLSPGDLVISTQPEQVSVIRYYLGDGLRWANDMGPVADPRVMDWRGALARLEASRVETSLAPQLAQVRSGQHLLLVSPMRSGGTPWATTIRHRARQWSRALHRDQRFRFVARVRRHAHSTAYSLVQAELFVRR